MLNSVSSEAQYKISKSSLIQSDSSKIGLNKNRRRTRSSNFSKSFSEENRNIREMISDINSSGGRTLDRTSPPTIPRGFAPHQMQGQQQKQQQQQTSSPGLNLKQVGNNSSNNGDTNQIFTSPNMNARENNDSGTQFNERICKGRVANLESNVPSAWWTQIFSDSLYLKTDGDVVEDPEITRTEVDMLESYPYLATIFRRGMASATAEPPRILDLCCGQGRHSIELARRYPRLKLHGHDQSNYLIKLARQRASTLGVSARCKFTEGDCRTIPYPPDTFDLVLIMGNSFGYFSSSASDLQVLRECFRVSRAGAHIVLDLTDGLYMKHTFNPRTWEWIDDSTFVCRERQLSKDGKCLVSREVVTEVDKGVVRDQFYAERLYEREEVDMLLEMAMYSPARDKHEHSSLAASPSNATSANSTPSLGCNQHNVVHHNHLHVHHHHSNSIGPGPGGSHTASASRPKPPPLSNSSGEVLTAAKELSKRKEDLGMMEQRMIVLGIKEKDGPSQVDAAMFQFSSPFVYPGMVSSGSPSSPPLFQGIGANSSQKLHQRASTNRSNKSSTTINEAFYGDSHSGMTIGTTSSIRHSDPYISSQSQIGSSQIPHLPIDESDLDLDESDSAVCCQSIVNETSERNFNNGFLGQEMLAETHVHGFKQGFASSKRQMNHKKFLIGGKEISSPIPPPAINSLVVILGDCTLSCFGKLNNTWNPEDLATRQKLIDVLSVTWPHLHGEPQSLRVLEHHSLLMEQLSEVAKDSAKEGSTGEIGLMVLNLCDEGYCNDALQELHVPALIEMLGLNYTGAKPACLGLCYDKGLVNASAQSLGVPIPHEVYYIGSFYQKNAPSEYNALEFENLLNSCQDQVKQDFSNICGSASPSESHNYRSNIRHTYGVNKLLTFPAFVKPLRGDNSLGITSKSLVNNATELHARVCELYACGLGDVIIQEYLSGPEFSVGVIGNTGTGFHFLPILQVDFTEIEQRGLVPILGFESKWDPTSPYWTEIKYKRAFLPELVEKALHERCALLFERFGCRDYARFDFRADSMFSDTFSVDNLPETSLQSEGYRTPNNNEDLAAPENAATMEEAMRISSTIKLLEVNPNPGWCWDGKLAMMAKLEGLTYSDILLLVLHAAVQRVQSENNIVSDFSEIASL
jgi:D-alanine-D-alanine ligase-like ATP-grasp enzyme/SAM-dependent methyltransferase